MRAKQSSNQPKIISADRARWTRLYAVGTEDGSGALVALDPDPNTTPPPANRIFRIGQPQTGTLGAACTVYATIFDGAPSIQPWVFDDGNNRWYKATGAVVVPGFFSIALTVGAGWLGAAFFFQVTANTTCHGFWLTVR